MASRDPKDLHPDLQPLFTSFMQRSRESGIDCLCTCTYRSGAEQDALYAQGRTRPGRIVTRAKSGQSAHNFTLKGRPASKAFDIVPMRHGKCVWDEKDQAWQQLGKIGVDIGLNWYGSQGSKFREFPHFELKEKT